MGFSGTEGNHFHSSRISDFGALEQSVGFRIEDAVDLSRSKYILLFSLAFPDINPSTARVGSQRLPLQKGQQPNLVSISSGHFENWAESAMADASPRTDTSTDVDTDDKNQRFETGQSNAILASDSSDRSKEKTGDQKTLRRLAQNREAARKSRLRKKVGYLIN
ncbi:hypothetical protein HHK36_017871 [Tetracentron sinense]|uniref:BZIP domain-containing protein n=1 Tax=Tetracentron sinense TaxID=13715 RepID=A0A835DAR5_TETSI|nr:hypothetical protein HHK36_017871 [Tetracentron sinense]